MKASKKAELSGLLENAVYFGTDTHYHVKLSDGGEFIIRQQNSRGGGTGFAAGEVVGIELEDKAAQVLSD